MKRDEEFPVKGQHTQTIGVKSLYFGSPLAVRAPRLDDLQLPAALSCVCGCLLSFPLTETTWCSTLRGILSEGERLPSHPRSPAGGFAFQRKSNLCKGV